MAAVEGIDKVEVALRKKAQDVGGNVSVVVGYSQAYAVYVHEDLEAHHPVGQAKFLEQPARELRQELGKTVRDGLKRGLTLEQSLVMAGLRLQRDSQQLCPVDTGALRASAFTRVEESE